MVLLTLETLDELLNYLEKSMENLAKEAFNNLEVEGGFTGVLNFLENQFDVRLENLLTAKGSSIHHLESGMKNRVIQKKQNIIESISKQYKT